MKTLSRPMFNMGGPIKQGVMHGIREPHKHGGKAALVGNPIFPKDKTGRAHHLAWFGIPAAIGWASRFAPAAYRGYKASRYMEPWAKNLGWAKRARQMFLPRKSLSAPMATGGEKAGFGFGSFAATNPGTTFALASSAPQLGYGAAKLAKEAPGGAWSIAKRYADAVIPGDQSRWWKDKTPIETVPGVPGGGDPGMYYDKTKKEPKKLSDAERKAFATKQRNERVDKYMKMMGYDRSKKMAIADALIDASKIVGDRGSLDLKNIGTDLINPIIQATSKRLDKPEQIREAVGLMATKAEIEKDLSKEKDALDTKYKKLQIEQGERALEEGFEKDMRDLFTQSRTAPDKKTVERYARYTADKYGHGFTKITAEQLKNAAGETEEEKIVNVVGDDGVYLVGDAIIKVTGGVPKLYG